MLSIETKRKIDNARDVLVGKIPNPQAQIEQITTALIYKFMDDMDEKSKTLGGKARFFVGDFEKYSWRKLLDPRIGGQERMNLYSEAVQSLSQNSALPQIFRDVFKDAFVPYRDPETLSLFLKEINWFDYHHSEELGNAYEYLLSIMSSQGDAGQFRTPRHIIDFIVEAVDPQKDETILDPACGTAGFLISAYKHIVGANDGLDDITGLPTSQEQRLKPEERAKMLKNFHGYDIDPGMVRLSLVNMYLHGFVAPNIEEYDSLTYEDRWNDDFDVILANPPFMTPKGGVRPHKRFQIQANRAEVLFVDYIAEHLKPKGRAGIVVPEGIIFQSGTAYKSLRKMLVEEQGLWAVVSLPAGVFQPYSGVKTSILLLDKERAKAADEILFIDVSHDGFTLGAQRTETTANDFPAALEVIRKWKLGEKIESKIALAVPKIQISNSGDYNLSHNLYKVATLVSHDDWPTATLEELSSRGEIEFLRGAGLSKSDINKNGTKCIHYGELYTQYQPIIKSVVSRTEIDGKILSESGDVLIPATTTADANGIAIARSLNQSGVIIGGDINIVRTRNKTILADYLSWVINYPLKKQLASYAKGTNIIHLSNSDIKKLRVIIPNIDVQQELVNELWGYQKVINGARQVIGNWKPSIPVSNDWESMKFKDAPIDLIDGDRGANYPKKSDFTGSEGHCLFLSTKNVRPDGFVFDEIIFISEEKDGQLRKGKLKRGDIVLTTRGTVGNVAVYDNDVQFENIRINSGMLIIRPDISLIDPHYLEIYLQSTTMQDQFKRIVSGSAQPQLPVRSLNEAIFVLPPITEQRDIVKQIHAEAKLANGNKKLVSIYEKKIQAKIAEVWGE